MPRSHLLVTCAIALALAAAGCGATLRQQALSAARSGVPPAAPAPVESEYVIGIDDTLEVVFWREKEMSASVAVRPDGKISLPLLNDIEAAGLTPEQLRTVVTQLASKYVAEPAVTVVVKSINSRKVFITGQVAKPGPYPLTDTMTVLQLISIAGGLNEYADSENISVVRLENGRTVARRFNYKNVAKGRALAQNIVLQPGDTVVIP